MARLWLQGLNAKAAPKSGLHVATGLLTGCTCTRLFQPSQSTRVNADIHSAGAYCVPPAFGFLTRRISAPRPNHFTPSHIQFNPPRTRAAINRRMSAIEETTRGYY